MASTKKNLPNIPIYIGDWERDCNVLSLEAEAAWLRIIFKMFTKGKQSTYKIPTKALQNLWRCSESKMHEILDELTFNEIAEIFVDERFIEFTCRRFKKENEISQKRKEAVSKRSDRKNNSTKDLQKPYKEDTNTLQTPDIEIENENKGKEDKGGMGKKEEKDFKPKEIIEQYNQICKSLPKVEKLTDARRTLIKTRQKEHGDKIILRVFEKAEDSNFLTGGSEKGWKANFDWLMNTNNFVKTLEGNYDNRESSKSTEDRDSNRQGNRRKEKELDYSGGF